MDTDPSGRLIVGWLLVGFVFNENEGVPLLVVHRVLEAPFAGFVYFTGTRLVVGRRSLTEKRGFGTTT
jgi:hypothetical protein